ISLLYTISLYFYSIFMYLIHGFRNNLSDLKAVWRDEKYRQFERLYAETMPQLEFFCKNAEQFAQYLRAKEKPLRRYQEHRY
ncbi:hypothetical protein M1N69_05530, partial [Thermodesulfovibrionales bacterium]|nr:hypothetical protein [Thermodesulfovibrionales bacterium]